MSYNTMYTTKHMKKLTLSLIFTIACLLVASGLSYADTTCQPIYGGGQTCVTAGNLLIDKKVQNPSNQLYVDNLGVNDPKYSPDQTVNFQINITNTGSQTLNKVTVKDILPSYVSYVSGPGSYDANTNTLTFETTDLKANETRTFTVTGKVASSNSIPQNQGVSCVINQAQGIVDGKASQDNAQFCIQQPTTPVSGTGPSKGGVIAEPVIPMTTKGGIKVFPPPMVTTTPATGPELFALIGLIPGAGLGFFLRKSAISRSSFGRKASK